MLTLPSSVRIHLASRPVDMRKSFDGLSLLAREVLREDPLSGHVQASELIRGKALSSSYLELSHALEPWLDKLFSAPRFRIEGFTQEEAKD